jgi:hypothetical protein
MKEPIVVQGGLIARTGRAAIHARLEQSGVTAWPVVAKTAMTKKKRKIRTNHIQKGPPLA